MPDPALVRFAMPTRFWFAPARIPGASIGSSGSKVRLAKLGADDENRTRVISLED